MTNKNHTLSLQLFFFFLTEMGIYQAVKNFKPLLYGLVWSSGKIEDET